VRCGDDTIIIGDQGATVYGDAGQTNAEASAIRGTFYFNATNAVAQVPPTQLVFLLAECRLKYLGDHRGGPNVLDAGPPQSPVER
jgi:hypothetical protein